MAHKPPRVHPAPRPVQLKRTVDIQLEQAFYDGQWTSAANLARLRQKSTKDEYYKAVEVAARSRSDNAADRTFGREAVQAMINDNTIIKDVDALDLYEFAIDGLEMDHSKTIGVLRARLVKALPKDQQSSVKCFEACMWHSDWENAQEIAASLTKNFPGDRKYLFHNIMTMSLVAGSEDTSEMKKKLFPNLVKAQADRAFNLRPTPGKEQVTPDKLDIDENEVLLWLEVRATFASPEENMKLLALPNWGPLHFLERGFSEAFDVAMDLIYKSERWDDYLEIANKILERVISIGQENAAKATQKLGDTGASGANKKHQVIVNQRYMVASREWSLWMRILDACRFQLLKDDQENCVEIFRDRLEQVVSVLRDNKLMPPVFESNYDRIRLAITFAQAHFCSSQKYPELASKKVYHVIKLAQKVLRDPSSYRTLRGFLGALNAKQRVEFVRTLGSVDMDATKRRGMFEELLLVALRLRVRFFEATSMEAGQQCLFCHEVVEDGPDCQTCLKHMAVKALECFGEGIRDASVLQMLTNEPDDPLANLAILGSLCLLKIAIPGVKTSQLNGESPLYKTDLQLYLLAVIWLDFYLRRNPRNDSLRMLLVKLYLNMGCVTRALQVWESFDVKNTLLESLGSMYIDRLASISPSHFAPGPGGQNNLSNAFVHHFETAIRKRYPEAAIRALQAGSYVQLGQSILLAQDQSRNCALVLAVVERRRGARLKSGKSESSIQDEPLIGSLSPDYVLEDATDYEPLPNWGKPGFPTTEQLVSYGPLPTHHRCHLGILAERFVDLVCYVQTKEFKPSKANQLAQMDWQGAATLSGGVGTKMDALLRDGEKIPGSYLTDPELWYFSVVVTLAEVVGEVLEHVLLNPPTKDVKVEILAKIQTVLRVFTHQTEHFFNIPPGIPARMHTLHGVAALHAMGMLRETSLATKNTVQYLTTALERLKTTDKSRGTNEAAWLSPELKKLLDAAALADAHIKDGVKKLNDNLLTSGWVDRLGTWVFGDNAEYTFGNEEREKKANKDFKEMMVVNLADIIPLNARETWAIDVADSWREVVRSWSGVKLD